MTRPARRPEPAAGAPPREGESAEASLLISSRALRWLVPLLVLHAGLFLALASPQRPVALVWSFALTPMFLALELALRFHAGGWRGRWLRVLACTYPVGVVFAGVTGDWVANTAHVYGHLPPALAQAVAWFGYGTLFGLELFFFLGVPFALTWRRPWLALALVPLWATVFQVYVPRFLFFTYGQAMYTALPLVQFADVLGSGGLNLLLIPLWLVLYYGLRILYAPAELSGRTLAAVAAGVALAFAAAWGYGAWRMEVWAAREAAGDPVQVVGIQPNFSLRRLASNPELAHSEREQSLRALLDDSRAALGQAATAPGTPTLLLWPESVYPRPYFYAPQMRAAVERRVRKAGVELVLATTDAGARQGTGARSGRNVYGAAVHVGPAGRPRGVYHKIALIPFGERIPFGAWLPFYRRLVLRWIPQISEFTPGTEHTVFRLANGVGLAPMICFDAANPAVARGMARNGARVGVVLANLAWFGRTTVSNQFGWFARFRAIENRMPLVFLSQNGESWVLDARGRPASPRLPAFERGALVRRVRVPQQTSFYTLHGVWVERAYLAALLALAAWAWRGRLAALGGRLRRRA